MTWKNNLIRLAMGLALVGVVAPALAEDVVKVERSPVGQFEPLFIGMEQGFFKKRNITLDIKIGTSPDGAIANVMSGDRDVAMGGAVPFIAAVANGLPVVATLDIQDQTKDVPTFGLVVPANSPIKTIEDLKGKKVGVPGIASPQGSALFKVLEAHKMTRDDIQLVNLPFPGVLSAIESGSVDAGMPIGLFYDLSVKKGMRAFDEVFNASTFGFPASLFIANKAWADSHKDLLTRFNEAMIESMDYANKNPDAIRKVDMEQTQMDKDYLKTRAIAPFVSSFSVKAWDTENGFLAKWGFISKKPDPAVFIWSGAPKK